MIATPHMLAGALAGTRAHSLTGAFALGALSHLALDMVPHTDYQLDDGKGLVLAADLGLGVALTYKLKNSADAPLLLTGVLGGVLPDVLAVSESWLGVRVSTPLHRFFHTRVRPPLAVSALTQITASAIFAFALRSRARQRQTL